MPSKTGGQTRLERARGIDNTKEQNQKVTFDAKNPRGSRAGLTDNPGKRRTVISGESVKRVKENPVFKYKPNNPFKTKEKMMTGGKLRGYGMARGGKVCKMR